MRILTADSHVYVTHTHTLCCGWHVSVIASEAEVEKKNKGVHKDVFLLVQQPDSLSVCHLSSWNPILAGFFFKVCEQSCVFVPLSGKLQNLLKSCCHLSCSWNLLIYKLRLSCNSKLKMVKLKQSAWFQWSPIGVLKGLHLASENFEMK